MFEPVLFENFADLDRTFAAFDRMRRHMEGMFPGSDRFQVEPRFSVEDRGDAYLLEAELPGVPADALELTLTGPVLELRARRNVEPPEGYTAHRRERPSYDLARSITLPTRVDASQVTAESKNGIVTVVLPKAAEARPRTIQVKNG